MAKSNSQTEVDAAFTILFEEIEEVVNAYAEEGAKASRSRDYATARTMLNQAELRTNVLQKMSAIREQWNALETLPLKSTPTEPAPSTTSHPARLRRGVRTPESEYYAPILTLLVDAGGSLRTAKVLEKLPAKMQGVLKSIDFEPLPSSNDEPRWRNAARFARNTMVGYGWLHADGKRGNWEITEQGRDWLDKGNERKKGNHMQ